MTQVPPHDVLFSADQIAQKVRELGARIAADHAGQPIHLVGVLKGSLPFLADLARAIDSPLLTFDFLSVRRKPGAAPELLFDLDSSVEGKDVVLVEDLVGEGRTLDYVQKLLSVRQPRRLQVCSLLRRSPNVELAYCGWDLAQGGFLVGYGLDLEEQWRHLPFIGMLHEAP